MVDTTTTVLGLTKQTIGANRNTWGNILNTNMDLIEEAICGRHAVSTTGGGTTLTQAQARKRFIDVSGALLSDATITVPNASKDWIITNSTSGDFAVLVKTSGGTATSIPAGTSKAISCDGSNNVVREDIAEVGQMAFFGNNATPAGWAECAGNALSRAGRGLDLFAKIGTTWGVGNGATTFNIPDANTAGKFLRARTASVTIATSQSDQNKAHTHSGSTASTSLSMAGVAASGGGHTNTGVADAGGVDHTNSYVAGDTILISISGGVPVNVSGPTSTKTSGGASAYAHTHALTLDSTANHTHTVNFSGSSASTTVTVASDGGTEVRPTNLSAILCIKF